MRDFQTGYSESLCGRSPGKKAEFGKTICIKSAEIYYTEYLKESQRETKSCGLYFLLNNRITKKGRILYLRQESSVCTKWHLLPLESLLKFLFSSSSAVSWEKLSSPKGFQGGWSWALRLEAAVVLRLGAEGALRLGAEEVARISTEVVTRLGTEVVVPHCSPDSYTLCWEDCGELDGVALADL